MAKHPIRYVGRKFANESMTEVELEAKLEEFDSQEPDNEIPGLGMAFKKGLQEGDCTESREETAWETAKNVNPDFVKAYDEYSKKYVGDDKNG